MNSVPLMESPPGPETVIDGTRFLYFGGTSYLGLAGHPDVIAAGCEALQRYGVHSATTRAGFGTIAPVLEVERLAAEFFGTEDAFYFGSGYVANHIMVSALASEHEVVLVDEASHFCIREAATVAKLPVIEVKHRDPEDLARGAAGYSRVLFLTEAVGPSSGNLAPVSGYVEALSGCDLASVVFDDAHGFGVLGDHGRGVLEQMGYWPRVNVGAASNDEVRLYVCGTLAKALGGFGGIIPGDKAFVDSVRSSSHYYDGASAPAAPVAGATAGALKILLQSNALRLQLGENIKRLRDGLRAMGLKLPDGAAANFGVAIGSENDMRALHDGLKRRGILVPYVASYSGIPDGGVMRFAVFANHTSEQIDKLLHELKALL